MLNILYYVFFVTALLTSISDHNAAITLYSVLDWDLVCFAITPRIEGEGESSRGWEDERKCYHLTLDNRLSTRRVLRLRQESPPKCLVTDSRYPSLLSPSPFPSPLPSPLLLALMHFSSQILEGGAEFASSGYSEFYAFLYLGTILPSFSPFSPPSLHPISSFYLFPSTEFYVPWPTIGGRIVYSLLNWGVAVGVSQRRRAREAVGEAKRERERRGSGEKKTITNLLYFSCPSILG